MGLPDCVEQSEMKKAFLSLVLLGVPLSAREAVQHCTAPGAKIAARHIASGYRLAYAGVNSSAVLTLPTTGLLKDLSLKTVGLPFAVAVLALSEDTARDTVWEPEFVEFDGRKLHRLPQYQVEPATSGETFEAAQLLLEEEQDDSRPLSNSRSQLRYRLVTRADKSHAVLLTSTVLSATPLNDPPMGPQTELDILHRPLRLHKVGG
jgi:hypothetical protein